MAWGPWQADSKETATSLCWNCAWQDQVVSRLGSKQTSPPRSELSREAWHKVRSNQLKAALLDSQPMFPLIPQMELECRTEKTDLLSVFRQHPLDQARTDASSYIIDQSLVSNPGFGQRFRENLILFAKKTTYIYYILLHRCPVWIWDLRPVPIGNLRLCSIIKSGPSGDLSSICKSDHPFSAHIGMLHCDHRSRRFLVWKATLPSIPEHAHDFSQISIPEKPSEVPQVGDSISAPCFPLWGPGPSLFLASTAAPLESKSSAALTRPLFAAWCSGVWPQAVSRAATEKMPTAAGTARVEQSWAPTVQPTNERWMFWTQHFQNCSKQKTFTFTMNKFQCIFLKTLPLMKRYAIAFLLMRPVWTMSAHTVHNMVWNQVQDLKRSKV